MLSDYAAETASGYCAGCARLCESVLTAEIPVSDVMRYLMYYHNYGNRRQAAEKFARIPDSSRRLLTDIDYSAAERVCPQNIPIGQFMQYAIETFGGGRKG